MVTTTITTGQSLYTTILNTAGSTEIVEIIVPTAINTTLISGSISTTVTVTAADGQPTIEVLEP